MCLIKEIKFFHVFQKSSRSAERLSASLERSSNLNNKFLKFNCFLSSFALKFSCSTLSRVKPGSFFIEINALYGLSLFSINRKQANH